ncbi:type II toxin-antitoxin system VapC family toxin [Salinibacterium sp.]|uniref:type II toxin-antitoxin system VapC family toxin n=1 Tax=Salinibacterium sp. TaxID=1915057 RepID=UPI00286CEF08|nr:type II toxin-antitoxin system VapC family toxin [Salinibacterium sp.]
MAHDSSRSRTCGALGAATRRADRRRATRLGVIYLDSCIVIYAVEDEGPRGAMIRQRLADSGSTEVAISHLVTMECLVGPMRNDNLALHDHYLRALARFTMLELGQDQFRRGAQLRAAHGLRSPDALHLAAAQLSGCDEVWTNDARLTAAARGLAVDVLA